jgi:hypothetical protein
MISMRGCLRLDMTARLPRPGSVRDPGSGRLDRVPDEKTSPATTAPATKKKDDKLREKLNPVHILAQVAWTIAWTFLGSFLGVFGTGTSLLVGALSSQILPTVFEHYGTRGAAAARVRYQQLRLTNMDPEAARRQVDRERRERVFGSLHWKVLGVSAAIVAIVTLGAITAVEASAGKPVTDIVRGQHGSGFTFDQQPAPSFTPEPSVTPTTVPSATPSADPSPSTPSSSPAVSGSPSTSPVPPSSLPASSPATTPPPVLVPSSSPVTSAPAGQQKPPGGA